MTLYETLGLQPTASADDIKHAFRALAKLAHPDTGGNPDDMAALNRAYEVLSDLDRRRRYDETGKIDGADNDDAMVLQMAFKAVESAIAAAPDLKMVDILAVATDALENDITNIKQQQENFRTQAQRYEDAIARIKPFDGETGKLHEMLGAQVAHLKRRVGEADPITARLSRAIAEIRKYRYEVEPVQQMAYPMDFGQQQAAGLGWGPR